MKNAIHTLTLLLFCFVSVSTFAQDIITKKDGKKIKVLIKEITPNEIKYIEYNDPNEIIFSMDRALIEQIKFAYGKKMKEENPELEEGYYMNDKANNLKFNFLALSNNSLILAYERALSPASSFETSFKFHGLGLFDEFDNEKGFGVDFGYKLKLGSLFKKSGTYRPNHLLHGSYFKPVIGFSHTKREQFNSTITNNYVHFGLQFGKQWILKDKVSLDLYGGFHYYGGSSKREFSTGEVDNSYNGWFNDGDLAGDQNRAFTFGLKVGGLFGKYGNKNNSKTKR